MQYDMHYYGTYVMAAAAGIRRMSLRSNVGRIVVPEIEDVMTFMFMGTNDLRVDRHMVGHQR